MKTLKPIVRATLALFLLMTVNGSTATINFELVNGTVPFEGMAISNQFQAYYGVTFRRAAGASEPWPAIARIGEPRAAFDRNGTNANDTVRPENAAAIGQFYLTDNAADTSAESALIIDFDAPVSQASGYILDIDAAEQVTVSAYADSTSTNALESRVFTNDSPGTGDGVATFWSFSRPARDIRRIEIDPASAKMGYDLFSSNYMPPPAGPTRLVLRTYPGLTIEGDVGRPYRIDYADKLDRTPSGTNWHVLTSLFLPHSPYLYMDLSPASSPERYYRAVALP